MSPRKPTKTMHFFGESTAKDAPAFLLAKALGVWGKPPPALVRLCRLHRHCLPHAPKRLRLCAKAICSLHFANPPTLAFEPGFLLFR